MLTLLCTDITTVMPTTSALARGPLTLMLMPTPCTAGTTDTPGPTDMDTADTVDTTATTTRRPSVLDIGSRP